MESTNDAEFLRGNAATDECEPLFRNYKDCLTRALKERGIDTMLDEARENNKENDAENMRRRSRWDLVTRLYELAIFAWDHGVVTRAAKGFLILSLFFFLFILPVERVAARESVDVLPPLQFSKFGPDQPNSTLGQAKAEYLHESN
ncbi:phosphatidylinositol N-acetylglucosaminyltransferase subunit gpi1 [Lignoscripta atroalba]|nr:phosphatidylinositol N-acetylglucosaminyltransferase subunit gpi1 [Lignoscripta atroalba]